MYLESSDMRLNDQEWFEERFYDKIPEIQKIVEVLHDAKLNYIMLIDLGIDRVSLKFDALWADVIPNYDKIQLLIQRWIKSSFSNSINIELKIGVWLVKEQKRWCCC